VLRRRCLGLLIAIINVCLAPFAPSATDTAPVKEGLVIGKFANCEWSFVSPHRVYLSLRNGGPPMSTNEAN
jgi:hypothetical protein